MKKRGFVEWMLDTNGKWGRKVEKNRYHVIEMTDMDDACGRDNEGQPRYVVELSEVDLDAISEKTVKSALESCGWYDERSDLSLEATVEAIHGYGAKAPLHSVTTHSWHDGFRECRKESWRLSKDAGAYDERMNTPVNKIGSTAREYMQGDIYSAMDRGVAAGDASAKLMARLHGVSTDPVSRGITHSIRLHHPELIKDSNNDPLAYSMGLMRALSGQGMDGPREDLAQAYVAGYKKGVAVRIGEAPKPEWLG